MKQIFFLTLFFIPVVAFGQIYSQYKPPKPKATLKGVWYYTGVGGLSDSSHLDSTTRIHYTKLPIKSYDTIAFVDSTALIVNNHYKYNYRIEYKWSDVGINNNSFWEMYLLINGDEYFVHFSHNYIELQNRLNNHRWYGRFNLLTKK